MLMPVLVEGNYEDRESVKDHFGCWICEGMFVNEVNWTSNLRRQGWVTEVIDEGNGLGKIKVQIVGNEEKLVTDFETSDNWCKALTEG